MRRRTAALLACALAAWSRDEPDPSPHALALVIRLDGAALDITRVYPVREFPFVHNPARSFLRYELRAADGSVVTAGHIPDPRAARAFEMDGSMDSLEIEQEWGSASPRLPATAGELVPVDARGDGVWDLELARAPFDPTATTDLRLPSSFSPWILHGKVLGDPVRIHGELGNDAAIDVLFVAEGYLESDMEHYQ